MLLKIDGGTIGNLIKMWTLSDVDIILRDTNKKVGDARGGKF